VQLSHNQPSAYTKTLFVSLLVLLTLIFAACSGPAAPAAPAEAPAAEEPAAEATEAPAEEAEAEATEAPAEEAAADNVTIYGEELPADARPYSEQIHREACSNTANQITFDFTVSVYQRFCGSDLFQDQLVNLDKDFNVIPNSAESWEVSEDGLTWTFHIKEGLQWSDGTPLTAHDYVATFQYAADPEHAWDFAWFYAGVLKNWNQIIAGELPTSELGVVAVDDLTLAITTEVPWPPLPGMMQFSFVMQKNALETHGPFYNNDPATSVSAGPFMLESIEPGNEIVLVANPNYKGMRQPRLNKIVYTYMSMATAFAAFQNNEIYKLGYEWLSPADFEVILNDSVLSANYLRHYGDFRTDYLLFDTFNPPFDNLDVRKAFAYAVDRESIVTNVYGEIKAMPAHAMLMPGFPASDTSGELAEYQNYNCELAQQHLADAGFPGGEGFPTQELWLRGEGPAMQAVFQAVAASISECLSIDIQVSNQDGKVYMDALNADPTTLTFGAVSYGMDFLDPSNLLGIWLSSGRHSWKNDEFDRMVTEASSMVGDPEAREQMFRDAEKILVDDVGGVFIAHRWQGDLVKPFLQGEGFREPDAQGIAAFHWGNDWVWGDMYLAQE
jgi:peptide/nickel transport system substrate-binding protein/oligopeptide transport system substrate-binding protein